MNKMAEKLAILLRGKNLRAQMGQDAKSSMDFSFSLTNMVRESGNLYEELAKRKGVAYGN